MIPADDGEDAVRYRLELLDRVVHGRARAHGLAVDIRHARPHGIVQEVAHDADVCVRVVLDLSEERLELGERRLGGPDVDIGHGVEPDVAALELVDDGIEIAENGRNAP